MQLQGFPHNTLVVPDLMEYMKAVVARLPKMPLATFGPFAPDAPSRVETFDLSKPLGSPFPATSPCLLVNFAVVAPGSMLPTLAEASSELFFVVEGQGTTQTPFGTVAWEKGDAFVLPGGKRLEHRAEAGGVLYWVHDAPLLSWLGVKPGEGRFRPVFMSGRDMHQALERVLKEEGALKRNRNGVIPVHPEFCSTKSLSPVLWSLINEVPPNHLQKPHRHTSVALDLAVEGAAVSTLVGDALEKGGAIQNAEAVRWEPGMAFTTPSWLWHAHKNDGDTPGLIFPVQDAGLVAWQRLYKIEFAP